MEIPTLLNDIRGGKATRDKAINMLYHDQGLRKGVIGMMSNAGKAQERFTEFFNLPLMQFIKTVIKKKDLTLKGSLNSYIVGIARNIIYQEFKKENRLIVLNMEGLSGDRIGNMGLNYVEYLVGDIIYLDINLVYKMDSLVTL